MIHERFDGSRSEALDRPFPGDSELAGLLRAFDWSRCELGPPSGWPQNLRVALGICLTSRFPMSIWWGASLTLFYNDAYATFLGRGKHPAVLARPGREAWSEAWDTLGPILTRVRNEGVANWSEDIGMFFDRELPKEEVYVTFSFSPIHGKDGRIDGLFCACTETTDKLISNRRLETLHKLGIRSEARTIQAACAESAAVLAEDLHDIPFAAIYVPDETRSHATLCATAGLSDAHVLPHSGSLTEERADPWPFAQAWRTRRARDVSGLAQRGLVLPGGPWPEAPDRAIVVPIFGSVQDAPAGLLVAGVSPRRMLDRRYRSFFDLVARHIGTAIADAEGYERERERAQSLAELDRAKTLFFTNVSHEFRTPLTLVIGPLEDALKDLSSADDRAVRPLLETAQRNAARLLRLVNTLLDFSRIQLGGAQASYEPTDLTSVTAELANTFRTTIVRAGLAFSVRCAPLPGPVFVDRDMWEKIVLNLLSNAFKFTFAGRIELTLEPAGERVVLRVKDTGIGVAPDELPRLFERFHRVEGARARTHEGSGIGLALVQELVHLHGGDVRVESELGKGTEFTVALRLGSAHLPEERIGAPHDLTSTATRASMFVDEAARWLPDAAGRTGSQDGQDARGPPLASGAESTLPFTARILVVDDNADMREYLARLLSSRYAVETAPDGMAALEAARRTRFDLVLTDVMMPRLDGFGLLKELRADPALRAIPVLVVSARVGEDSRIQGLVTGADDYLIKPFSSREVLARVEAHLQQVARCQAMEANRAKDEFLAMLGHELRNPLSPIMTAVQLLRLRDGASRELDVIDRQLGHLVRLVDDLLDVSRIVKGKIELRRQRFELSTAVTRGIEMASPMIEKRRQRIDARVPAEGLPVCGDPDRLAQVVSNLLTNASKYSASGARIELEAVRRADRAELAVRDEGAGIQPEFLGRVFDLFVQGPQALDRARGGLGLGLAIVRSLIEQHGGKVSARSAGLGQGSEFVVELPLSLREGSCTGTACAASRSEVRAPAGAHEKRILVVDDNSDSAEQLARALTQLGYQVEVAFDGPSALERARGFKPDVCMLDLGLPVMDGYELARRLLELGGSAKPRLVAVTGYGQDSDRRRSKEAGFSAHLVKPASLEELIEAMSA